MAANISTTSKSKLNSVLQPETLTLLSGLPDPMIVAGADGDVVFANRPAMELLGSHSISGLKLRHICAEPEAIERLCRRWLRSPSPTPAGAVMVVKSSHTLKCRLLGARLSSEGSGGGLVWVRITPMEDANSHFVVLNEKIHELAKEITLRRDAEERLRSQNDLLTKQKQLLEWIAQGFELRRILEALVETVQQHTKSGTVISILLLDNEGVHLRHVVDSGLPTEYRHLIDGIAIGPSVGSCGTAAHTRKPVFVGDMLEHPLWERHREAALLSGMRACWSTPIMSQDQAVLGTFALYYPEPFPDTSDDLHIVELCTSTAAVAIQRANLEERRAATENALRRTETLAAAGRLAATVAHEINNPLAAVTNLIFLAKTNPDTPESIQELLHTADREIARVSHIAHRTVGFYRDNSSPRLVSLSKLVEEVLELYFLKFSNKGLRLQKRIQPDVGVWATEGEIRQVISNLVSNAIDACADNATINVRVTNRTSGNGVTGGKVLVADTGSGIPPYARSRVFEPFFTTKQDVGTGLGLWISKSIADKHRGSLSFRTCTTPKNQGTVFSLFIPRDAMHPNHNASPLRGQQ